MKHIYLVIMLICLYSAPALAQQAADALVRTEYASIRVYPNPTVESFSLDGLDDSITYITINNIIGKQLKKVKVYALDQNFDATDLSRGVYIIRIFDKKDQLIKAVRLSKA